MTNEEWTLRDAWALRNAAADVLIKAEEQMRRRVQAGSDEQLVRLVEEFSPTRSPGPEWTRTFEPLVERLWAWCSDEQLAALERTFRARGPAWLPVANAFSQEWGAELRMQTRHPTWARFPAFTLA